MASFSGVVPGWQRPTDFVEAEEQSLPDLDLNKVMPPQLQWLAEYVQSVAGNIQAPAGLVGPMALACASAAATRGFAFEGRPGHTEIAAVWVAGGAAPGERKSTVVRHLSRPFRQRPVERKNESGGMPGWMRSMAGFDPQDDADFWKPKPKLRPGGQHKKKSAFSTEDSQEEDSQIITDTSMAGIIEALRDNAGRACVYSDEASFVDRAVGRKSEGLDAFLKGWSGDDITVRRAGKRISIARPQLTIGLLVQEEALRAMFTDKRLVQRGFTQRFLLSVPKSQLRRSYGSFMEVPQHLEFAWTNAIRQIDDVSRGTTGVPRTIPLSEDGMKAYVMQADHLDELRCRSQCYPIMAEWLSKSHGQLLRIAGLLTLLESVNAVEITSTAVVAAAQWIDYFRLHFLHFLVSANRLSPVQEQAQRVVQWLRAQCAAVVTRSHITQSLRCKGFETAESWLPVFELLVEKGWIRLLPSHEVGEKGGRPCIQYEVHPSLHINGVIM